MQTISSARQRFNSLVSTLRDQKRCLLVKLNGIRLQLTDIHSKLGITGMQMRRIQLKHPNELMSTPLTTMALASVSAANQGFHSVLLLWYLWQSASCTNRTPCAQAGFQIEVAVDCDYAQQPLRELLLSQFAVGQKSIVSTTNTLPHMGHCCSRNLLCTAADVLSPSHMHPDEEPENQLLKVTSADIAAYKAAKKAARQSSCWCCRHWWLEQLCRLWQWSQSCPHSRQPSRQ